MHPKLKTENPFSLPPSIEAVHPHSMIPFGSLLASQQLEQTQGTQAPALVSVSVSGLSHCLSNH